MATSNANWLGWSGNPAADLQRFGQAVYREMPKDQDILNAIGLGGGNRSGYLGPAYGDPAVLVGDSDLSNLPVDTRDAEIKLRQQQGGYLPPGMNTPVLNNPAADQERNRKSEADRMMQQYASDEYWDTEAGKAMLELGAQERYTGDDLAGFYDAQQAVGEGSIEEIIDAMGYTGNMAEWARANKALALREYLKNSEALPDDGYAGYGTGEPQVDERLKDVTNQFLQQRVDQLKDREDGPLWGPEGPPPPPVVQTQEQPPNLPGFSLPGQADGLSELIQSLGTQEILDRIDETGGGLAEKAGEWYGRKWAKEEVPGANLPFIGDWIQDEGARRGGAKGREYWNQYTGPFLQPN